MKSKYTGVIILAAGNSKRFIDKQKKQIKKINSKTVLDTSIEYFIHRKDVKRVLVTENPKIPLSFKYRKNVVLIKGGKTRSKSVYNALSFFHKNKIEIDNVLIHDAARPFIKTHDINRLMNSKVVGGIALGYPVTNALKLVNKNCTVTDNIHRENMFVAFTPQLFNFKKLYDSYYKIIKNNIEVDDDLEAMMYNSHKVKLMISSPGNIKITYKEDFDILNKLLS